MDEYKTYQVPTSEPIWKEILGFVGLLLSADVFFYVWWAMSGQYPADNFFLGKLTATLLGLFM